MIPLAISPATMPAASPFKTLRPWRVSGCIIVIGCLERGGAPGRLVGVAGPGRAMGDSTLLPPVGGLTRHGDGAPAGGATYARRSGAFPERIYRGRAGR